MTAAKDRGRAIPTPSSSWASLAAPTLILVTLVAQYLTARSYNLFLPETLIALSAAAVVGLALGATARLRPSSLEPLLLGYLLVAFIAKTPELADPIWQLVIATGELSQLIASLVFLILVAFLLCWLLRLHLAAIVSTAFAAMLLATVLLPADRRGPITTGALPESNSDLPPVIHIILDEHIGLAGLPPEMEASAGVVKRLRSTYHNFAVHTHAYSRFAETEYALASMVNGDSGPDLEGALTRPRDSHTYRMVRNDWFRNLKDRGYAIKVYQSSHLDLCKDVDACYTYASSISHLQETNLTPFERAAAILGEVAIPGWPDTTPLAALKALDRFVADIKRNPRGTAFILHLIFPHHGYLLDDDCAIVNPTKWEDVGNPLTSRWNTPEQRTVRYGRYLSQVSCAAQMMAKIFAELKRLDAFDVATIIVHGDHGSRLGEVNFRGTPAETLSERDVIDHFSTLLAVRSPGFTRGESDEPITLQTYFAREFLKRPGDRCSRAEVVYVRETRTRFGTREMPWSASLGSESLPC